MANMLYNGVELPDINTVWTDKETYPYAVIFTYGSSKRLTIFNSESRVSTSGVLVATNSPIIYAVYKVKNATENWDLVSSGNSTNLNIYGIPGDIFWSNHDILNSSDNSIYLAASTPVDPNAHTYDRTQFLSGLSMGLTGKGNPANTINAQNAFLKGYIVGAALRRKRVADIITGDINGLQFNFDQTTLQLDVIDSGVEGTNFTLSGSMLTIDELRDALVILDETTYIEFDYIGGYSGYVEVYQPMVNVDYATMKQLYEAGATITIYLNGVRYESKVSFCEHMDSAYIIGNPVIVSYGSHSYDIGETTGTGVFAMVWFDSGETYLYAPESKLNERGEFTFHAFASGYDSKINTA